MKNNLRSERLHFKNDAICHLFDFVLAGHIKMTSKILLNINWLIKIKIFL